MHVKLDKSYVLKKKNDNIKVLNWNQYMKSYIGQLIKYTSCRVSSMWNYGYLQYTRVFYFSFSQYLMFKYLAKTKTSLVILMDHIVTYFLITNKICGIIIKEKKRLIKKSSYRDTLYGKYEVYVMNVRY